MAIPSALGYPQYAALDQPVVSRFMTAQYYCESIVPFLTTTRHFGELRNCGDQITFYREPAAKIFDYEKDMTLDFDYLQTCSTTLVIDRAKYWNLKLDRTDLDRVCMIPALRDAYLRNAVKELAWEEECEFLSQIYLDVDECNRGAKAGARTASVNLGTEGAPITIVPTKAEANGVDKIALVDWLANLNVVHQQVCAGRMEEMFLVLPHDAYPVFMRSELVDAETLGRCINCPHPFVTGELPPVIMGFRLWFTNCCTRMFDDAVQKYTYHILSGRKDAIAWAQVMNMTEVVEKDSRSLATFFRGLHVYGWGTLYPEFLADSYVTFSMT